MALRRMHQAGEAPTITAETVADLTIRELVERYPATLEALAPYGIDLCCGGAHRLVEALDLHGVDRETAIPRVLAAIESAAGA